MIPTEQEIAFFKEAKRIQELWEPKHYDVVHISGQLKLIIPFEGEPESVAYVYSCPFDRDPMGVMRGVGLEWHPRKNITWLPRQGQLQAMLVEKGYTVCLTGPYMLPKNYQVILAREDNETEVEYGPTPSIALAKCLLEVLKEEKSADSTGQRD